jgi:hypothetical protein
MYKIQPQEHEQYGSIIEILRDEEGNYLSPFEVERAAKRLGKNNRVRFLIDEQIFNANQLEAWARSEYQFLPKCQNCSKILFGQVFSHSLSGSSLFCSQSCADHNYHQQVDHFNDYEECDI